MITAMQDDEVNEIQEKLNELGEEMVKRNVTANGFVALAAFTSFMGALVVLGGFFKFLSEVGKYVTRILGAGAALAVVFEPFRTWIANIIKSLGN